MKRDIFSVLFASTYLFIYCLLLQFAATWAYGFIMALFSPLLLCWMGYTVLKHGEYKGRELGKDEFGYQDKENEKLGVL